MRKRPLFLLATSFLCCSLVPIDADAETIYAANCSESAVFTAYGSASSGDIISVPAGDCSWTSTLTITKDDLTIQGAGIDSTTITGGNASCGFYINADGVRITGFTFDINHYNMPHGMVRIGVGGDNTDPVADFRIDNNKFVDARPPSGDSTGYNAVSVNGYAYGVIDNNQFVDCNSEPLDVCADPANARTRSTDFGEYTNGTVFIEDNKFTYPSCGTDYEDIANCIDGNSGARWVFRYNTITIPTGQPGTQLRSIVEMHGFCCLCSGSKSVGDQGCVSSEAYGNIVNNNATLSMFSKMRGGKALIYENTFNGNYPLVTLNLRNYRSWKYGICDEPANSMGYEEEAHVDTSPWLINEGLEPSKTTLAEDLDNSETSVDVNSVTDFPTYGGSIIVGSEQIDYTGISGTTLTGCTRGANDTSAATHNNNDDVDLLIFGVCLHQISDTYVWGNTRNTVTVDTDGYTEYDIQSYATRPNNWQYRNDGTAYSYTPYPYPHPLRTGASVLQAPQNLRIVDVY